MQVSAIWISFMLLVGTVCAKLANPVYLQFISFPPTRGWLPREKDKGVGYSRLHMLTRKYSYSVFNSVQSLPVL